MGCSYSTNPDEGSTDKLYDRDMEKFHYLRDQKKKIDRTWWTIQKQRAMNNLLSLLITGYTNGQVGALKVSLK